MFELKIQTIDGKSSFGWQFKTTEQINEFLEKQFSKGSCPYAPIVERDEEGNVISTTPNPDWTIEVIDNTQTEVNRGRKEESIDAARLELKDVKSIVALAKRANKDSDYKEAIVELSKAVLKISKVLGLADSEDS